MEDSGGSFRSLMVLDWNIPLKYKLPPVLRLYHPYITHELTCICQHDVQATGFPAVATHTLHVRMNNDRVWHSRLAASPSGLRARVCTGTFPSVGRLRASSAQKERFLGDGLAGASSLIIFTSHKTKNLNSGQFSSWTWAFTTRCFIEEFVPATTLLLNHFSIKRGGFSVFI